MLSDEFKNSLRVFAFLIALLTITAPALGNDSPTATGASVKPNKAKKKVISSSGYQEIEWHLNKDNDKGIVYIYHSQTRNKKGDFESVAVFTIRRLESLIPIYILSYEERFPQMLSVMPIEDEDGTSDFIICRYSAGASHVTTDISIIKLTMTADDDLKVETLFTEEPALDADVRLEAGQMKGRYILYVGKKSINLVNGRKSVR